MSDDERDIRAALEEEAQRAPRPQGLRRATVRRGFGRRIGVVALPLVVVASVAWVAVAQPFAAGPRLDVAEPAPGATAEGGEILCQFTAGLPSEPWRDKVDINVKVRGDELVQRGEVIRREVVGSFRVLLDYNHDGSGAPRFGFSVGDVDGDLYTLGGYSSEFSMDGDGSVVLPVNQLGSGFTGTGRVAHPSSNDYLTYYCRTL